MPKLPWSVFLQIQYLQIYESYLVELNWGVNSYNELRVVPDTGGFWITGQALNPKY